MTQIDIQRHLDALTKPIGSLGRLEDLAGRLCHVQQTLAPRTTPRRIVLFAADHGVVEAGVTVWPSDVTGLMVANIVAGGAASSVLAAATRSDLRLIDVGTQGPIRPDGPNFLCRKVRAGSRNLAREPALTIEEFRQAVAVGEAEGRAAVEDGIMLVVGGEMGIGNSTPASCLTSLLAGISAEDAVGLGAGADASTLNRKRAIVRNVTAAVRSLMATDPETMIAAVGGLEIAALAGFYRRASASGLTIVLDGFIATAAALVAERLWPGTAARMIAAHLSSESGHAAALRQLGLRPFLDNWGLRLGEGTGAIVLLPLLDAAAAIVTQMATFDQAGIRSHEP